MKPMEILAIAKQLIKIKSITDSPEESKPVDFIKQLLKKECPSVNVFVSGQGSKKNLVAITGQGKKSVMLNGHFDVVGGPDRIFKPIIRNGLIFGRGAVDDKGPLACLIKSFLDLNRQNLDGRLILACVCDEENAGELGSQVLREKGVFGDFNVFAEPTNLIPIIAEKGFLRIKVKSFGKSAHAAFPEKGRNAIEKLLVVLPHVKRIVRAKDRLLGDSTVSIGLINGGEKINVVPDYCEAGFDIRYLPNQNPTEIIRKIQNRLKSLGKFKVEIISKGEPISTKANSKLVPLLSRITRKEPRGISFATDARFFADKQSIVFGPGEPKLAHQDRESIKIAALEKGVRIYKKIVSSYLNKGSLIKS